MKSTTRAWPAMASILLTLGLLCSCGGGSEADEPQDDDSRSTASAIPRPVITAHPADITVTVGATATFRIQASGANSYQWYRNGRLVKGQTRSDYTTGRTSLADDGDSLKAVVMHASGGKRSSATVHLRVVKAASTLANHTWGQGAAVTGDTILFMTSAVDDAGHIVTAFMRRDAAFNTRLYTSRASPAQSGRAPKWSKPVLLASFAPSLFTATLPIVAVAPGGDAMITWTDTDDCSIDAYQTGTCLYVYAAEYDAGDDRWQAATRLADTVGQAAVPRINDRGDVAILFAGWYKGADGRLKEVPGILRRASGKAAFQRQVLTDVADAGGSTFGGGFALDAAGAIAYAGLAQQNSTRDIVLYRGDSRRGLGKQEIIDRRSSVAEFDGFSMGLHGQLALSWWQNNGAARSRYVAVAKASGAKFSVFDIGDWARSGQSLVATDSGSVLMYNLRQCQVRRWSSKEGMSPAASLPDQCSRYGGFSADQWLALARNGNWLAVSRNSADQNSWALYDAERNVMVEDFGGKSPGAGYLFGSKDVALRASAFASAGLFLLPSGLGGFVATLPYDSLPTASEPEGDGRPGVENLWAMYLAPRR